VKEGYGKPVDYVKDSQSMDYPKESYGKPMDYPKEGYGKPEYPKDSYSKPMDYPKDSYGKDSYSKPMDYPKDSYGKDSYSKDSYGKPEYPKDSYSKPMNYQKEPYSKPMDYKDNYNKPRDYSKDHYGKEYPKERPFNTRDYDRKEFRNDFKEEFNRKDYRDPQFSSKPPFQKTESRDRFYDRNNDGYQIERTKSTDRKLPREDYPMERTSSNVQSIAESIEKEIPENPIVVELKKRQGEEQKILMDLERIRFEHDRAQREADRFGSLYQMAQNDIALIDL
jgi:hypothetical protein